jgi:cell division protein FtsB
MEKWKEQLKYIFKRAKPIFAKYQDVVLKYILKITISFKQTDPHYYYELLQKLGRNIIVRKYLVASFLFFIWIAFFDNNSWLQRQKLREDLDKYQKDKEYYLDKIHVDSIRLHELKHDVNELEKFARERYFMKRPNEDIFVIVEKKKEK